MPSHNLSQVSLIMIGLPGMYGIAFIQGIRDALFDSVGRSCYSLVSFYPSGEGAPLSLVMAIFHSPPCCTQMARILVS